eukprot:2443086-Ditylum_brightwellii.AAC.2
MSKPRRHSKRKAGMDLNVQSFVAQMIADMLSHWRPMCLWTRVVVMFSRQREPNTIPANSISLIVNAPDEVSSVWRRA